MRKEFRYKPGAFAEALQAWTRGEDTTEALAAAVRVADVLNLIEAALRKSK